MKLEEVVENIVPDPTDSRCRARIETHAVWLSGCETSSGPWLFSRCLLSTYSSILDCVRHWAVSRWTWSLQAELL
jgi:hypothetical protein